MRISFEFFPPRTAQGRTNLVRTAARLHSASPEFFSVTYGAGGSTRDRTSETVQGLCEAGFNTAPHLSWGQDTAGAIEHRVADYLAMGVSRIVALRGDIPAGPGLASGVRHAEELVGHIRKGFGDDIRIEVGCYPEVHPDAPSPDADIAFLKRKVDAGANTCITQYFYNPDSYFFFVDRCRKQGIRVPIVAGIMPITNYEGLTRFSDNCGAEIPRWIRLRLLAYKDDPAALRAFGTEVVASLCTRLLDGGAPGLHFYTLNKADPTEAILRALNLVEDAKPVRRVVET